MPSTDRDELNTLFAKLLDIPLEEVKLNHDEGFLEFREGLSDLIAQKQKEAETTLASAMLNMRPLIALKNGNGDIDGNWYVMYWDDKDQVWNRARYADIVKEVRIEENKKWREQLRHYESLLAGVPHPPAGIEEWQINERIDELESPDREEDKQ